MKTMETSNLLFFILQFVILVSGEETLDCTVLDWTGLD